MNKEKQYSDDYMKKSSVKKDINWADYHLESEYEYKDREGNILWYKRKYRHKDGKKKTLLSGTYEGKKWKSGLDKDIEKPLFRLPEFLVSKNKTRFICEGEKDVDNLRTFGHTAVCGAFGAKYWNPAWNQLFITKEAILVPDNDEAGQAFEQKVGENLIKVTTVHVARIPKEYKDFSQWKEAGNDKEAFKKLKFEKWKSKSNLVLRGPKKKSILSFAMSDIGNAERLIEFFGQKLAYCHQWGKWFIWNKSYWKEDQILEVQNLMQYIVKQIGIAAANLSDEDERKWWWKFCMSSSTSHRIAGAISLARSHSSVAHITPDFDTNHYLLNVKNGTIDLRTGAMRPFKQSDFITKMANITYDPEAKCPLWDVFLEQIMDGNQDLINFLYKAAGYSFTADVRERMFFILYGTGDNGKSTFLSVLRDMLSDYACATPATTLYATQYEQHPTYLARLREKRLVIATETEEDKKLAEGLIKQLTTGEGKEPMVAHFMRQDDFEFPPLMKVWFGTNHKPKIQGTDKGIWRRICLVPFSVTIPLAEQVGDLNKKLELEFPGIFNRILKGCVKWWNEKRLYQPKEVTKAISEYKSTEDIAATFVKDAMIVDNKAVTPTSEIYKRYKEWCKDTGEWPPMKKNNLSRKLSGLHYKLDRPGGVSSCCGLRIKEYETSY